jgi:S1-C subfamily serine protease
MQCSDMNSTILSGLKSSGLLQRSAGFALLFFAWGCSIQPMQRTSTVFVRTPMDSVLISIDDFNDYEGFHYRPIDIQNVEVELEHYQPYYLFKASREGYFDEVMPVFPERYNWRKGVDLAGIASGVGMATAAKEAGVPWVRGLGIGVSVGAGLAWLLPNRRLYTERYRIPDMVAMPAKPDSVRAMVLYSLDLNLPAEKFVTHSFENIADFNNRAEWSEESSPSGWEEGEIETNFVTFILNDYLYEKGYQRGEEPLFYDEKVVPISGRVKQITEIRVADQIMCYAIESQWWRSNPFDFPSDTVTVNNLSVWGPVGAPFEPDYELLQDGIGEALVRAGHNPKILRASEKLDALEARWRADWDSIYIPEIPMPTLDKFQPDVLESVVTIYAENGHGSGCILTSDGLILTNYHVVSDTSMELKVRLHSGEELPLEVVRYHPFFDLALIRVATEGLKPFHTEQVTPEQLGESIFAIGTPFHTELPSTLTRGILSGFREDGVRKLLQTDVGINPGNSGGALVQSNGSLIGIVTEKIHGEGIEGLGFAVNIEGLKRALHVVSKPGLDSWEFQSPDAPEVPKTKL